MRANSRIMRAACRGGMPTRFTDYYPHYYRSPKEKLKFHAESAHGGVVSENCPACRELKEKAQ